MIKLICVWHCLVAFQLYILRWLISRQHIFRRLISRFCWKVSLSSLDSSENLLDELLSSTRCSRFGCSDELQPLFLTTIYHCFLQEACCGACQRHHFSHDSHICADIWRLSLPSTSSLLMPTNILVIIVGSRARRLPLLGTVCLFLKNFWLTKTYT